MERFLKRYFMPDPPEGGNEEEEETPTDGVGGSPRDRNGEEGAIEETDLPVDPPAQVKEGDE